MSIEDAEIELGDQEFKDLLRLKIIQQSEDGYLIIKFLDEQYEECIDISKVRSKAAKARWRKANELQSDASALQVHSSALQVNADKNRTEEKEEKEDIKALPPIKNHPIVDWIEKNTPTLNKMKQPLTNDEAQRLMEDLKIVTDAQKQKLKNIMLNMENYKPLLSKSKSTNLTIRNWWKRDNDNGRTETVDLSYKKPTGEKYVR
jgi:hypothetical protein